ncbi:MAG TPA: hypothetical protein VLH75_01110 [Longimicrobiales bacterium]|nr:hypothetical protein [Longimicrobiales bacterium]
MRFAYIDSQGNEVSIPSVDALALRIELGAIGPDTDLYDAQADRWGPAQTHEIFHTLSRNLGGEGGFVAPPPPVAPPPDEPAPPPPAPRPAEPPPHLRDEFMPMEEPAPETGTPDFTLAPSPSAGGAGDFGLDLDLTPAAPPPAAAAPAAAPKAAEAEAGLLDFSMPAEPEPEKKAKKKEEEAQPGSFDFGGGLELAPDPFAAPEPSAAPPAMDFSPGSGVGGSTMDLEPAMSDFTRQSPPAWMREEGPAAKTEPAPEDGALDVARRPAAGGEAAAPRRRSAGAAAAAASSQGAEEEQSESGERPAPRNRPSPPKRTRSRPLAPLILGVVGLAVVGGGGFFGWKAFQGRRAAQAAEEATPALPPVTIPSIPAELLPRMRDVGELALGDMLVELGTSQSALAIPVEPNRDWLAGIYLADASRFKDVQAFWEGIGTFVDQVRDSDTRVFHERYQARLAELGVAADTAAILLERADSGFLSTREDRFEAYALMGDLVTAALDLHEFLLVNEAKIEYAPAAGGVSRDPVLEAVPATKELGEEMWDRVDRITAALDAMGTLDKVTTERLTAVLFDRIRRAGFR